jgi:hypothetical protein
MGQPAGKERKKYLKLGEQEWEQVNTFVKDYFRDRDKAEKATYNTLFREIGETYPGIVLEKKVFKRHVATLEQLKRQAGIHITKYSSQDDRNKLKDIFVKELIGLNLEALDSIRFDQLIQRAHTSNVELDIAGKNKSTLAYYFPLHELKALARAERPSDEATAPLGHSVQAQKLPNPPAPGAAAAIDGQRQVEHQGQLGAGAKRRFDIFDLPGSPDCQDESDRPQRSAESAVHADDMEVDSASGPPPESQAAASTHAEAEVLRRDAVEPDPRASECDCLTSLLSAHDDCDRSSDAQPKDAEERKLEHTDEAPSGKMIMVCAQSLARLDNFMIQNQLRIILINGTGDSEGLEADEPEEVSEAQRLLSEAIQQDIRQRAARNAPGFCQ